MKKWAFYNEIEPYAAEWLRNLIKAGHITDGVVDERSIEDVHPDDVREFERVHWFAGVGVWDLALNRAGWTGEIWTGSCPCQPFSAAGKGAGFADERHLWPAFHWLIQQCRPAVVAGEQVASKDGLGWLDLVQADLEGTGYASRAVDLCAAGVGAPHIRQRLWWIGERLADASIDRRVEGRALGAGHSERIGSERSLGRIAECSSDGRLGDDDEGLEGQRNGHQAESGWLGEVRPVAEAGELGGLADARDRERDGVAELRRLERDRQDAGRAESGRGATARRDDVGMADAANIGWIGRRASETGIEPGSIERSARLRATSEGSAATGPTNGHWRAADWLFCRDGRWRPVEPFTFPLVNGAPSRVGRLRAYGNAIVADCAQAFIEAYLETEAERFRLTEVSLLSPAEDVFS